MSSTDRKNLYTKTSKRILCARLEHFYADLLGRWDFHHNYGKRIRTETQWLKVDRRFRITLKSCEHLLAHLGSDLFKNDALTSIRKTTDIKARRSKPNDKPSLANSRRTVGH